MPAQLAHFAINASDLDRARAFYQRVFGWQFQPWGPPGFYLISTPDGKDPGVRGAMQQRRELVPGQPANGFECTISVDSIDQTAAAVEAAGGAILMQKAAIPGVGTLIFFKDPEGNIAGAIEYETRAE
jgi:predicted enzyme related to lactoylglutathione lyase